MKWNSPHWFFATNENDLDACLLHGVPCLPCPACLACAHKDLEVHLDETDKFVLAYEDLPIDHILPQDFVKAHQAAIERGEPTARIYG